MGASWKRLALAAAALPLAFSGITAIGSTNAFAYGHADSPIRQVEISGNCDNASYCDSTPLGTSGFWIWAELAASSPNATSGSVDAAGAGCGHTIGGPGAGAGGGPANGTWKEVTLPQAVDDRAFPVDVAVDASGHPDLSVRYFEITLDVPVPILAVPVPIGHYSVTGLQFGFPALGPPPPGVNFQTQVAP